jgi:two-component system, NtrC family, sensor histidine kinase PilS
LLATAIITLGLLLETTLSTVAGITTVSDFVVTGLTGASLFALTLLAIPLANRLRASEALVQQRDIDLANLNELNEFIVQHLRESILVVDENDRVRLINDTAARLLAGGKVTERRAARRGVAPPALPARSWRRQEHDRRDSAGEVVPADGGTVIRPHFVALSKRGPGPVLVFLEDTSVVAERVQQSKLAALGRLSASIAHEIRNPVGAMSHAGQLLRDSPALTPDDRNLTDIIEKNAVRVSQIIENVLQLSRRDTTRQDRIDLSAWLDGFLAEFRATLQLADGRLGLEAEVPGLEVQFDPSHLHQVLWNLCDNALKHAAGGTAAPVLLRIGRIASSGRPYLEVADRGTGIDPANAERIFEPFFTNGTGGTGLGLFISRELCQTNGALLAYEARAGGGSVFRIIFADPRRWQATNASAAATCAGSSRTMSRTSRLVSTARMLPAHVSADGCLHVGRLRPARFRGTKQCHVYVGRRALARPPHDELAVAPFPHQHGARPHAELPPHFRRHRNLPLRRDLRLNRAHVSALPR